MTWIRTVPPASADEPLRRCYEAIYGLDPAEYGPEVESVRRPDGTSDSIVQAHSLIPEAMRHMMSGLAVMLSPDLPLTRRQHEMIAAVVSKENSCFY